MTYRQVLRLVSYLRKFEGTRWKQHQACPGHDVKLSAILQFENGGERDVKLLLGSVPRYAPPHTSKASILVSNIISPSPDAGIAKRRGPEHDIKLLSVNFRVLGAAGILRIYF
jgi:hypothetical protein